MLRDLLSHRTGLPNANFMFSQQYGEFLMPRNEIVRLNTFLEAVRPFREKFLYLQWNYGLVTEVVEAVTGKTLGSYIKDNVPDALSMRRTTLGKPDDENVAVGHTTRNNGDPCKIWLCRYERWCWSCWRLCVQIERQRYILPYQSLLRAKQDQAETKLNRTSSLLFMHTNTIFLPSHWR